MNIQSMVFNFNELNALQKPKLQQTNDTRKDDFSSVLKGSQKRHEPKKGVESQAEKTPKGEAKQVNKTSTEKPTTKEVAKVEESISKEDVSEETKKVMEAVASLLQITPQQLEELLGTMDIGIADLLQGNNLQGLMMKIHNLEESIELLQVPEIVSEIKMITAIIKEYEAGTLNVVPQQELLAATLEQSVKEEQLANLGAQIVKKPEQSTDLTSDKSTRADVKPEKHIKDLKGDLDTDQEVKGIITTDSSDHSSPGQGQLATGQDQLANQLIDNLSQSMATAFQGQNEQVNSFSEIAETVRESTQIIDPKMVLDQIVEKINVSTVDEQARMNIQLKPEHLGKLSMEVVSKQGILTAQFIVENERTKELVEQNIQHLRETLESKGLVIQELEVTVGQNENQENQAFQNPRARRNVSEIIERMMNEETEEAIEADHLFDNGDSEVDYIA